MIQTCLLISAFYSLINITPTQYRTIHSQAQYKLHNTKIYAQKITQCKLHAGMRPYVRNKYF